MARVTPALFNALRLAGVIGGVDLEPQALSVLPGLTGVVAYLDAVLPSSTGFTKVSGTGTISTGGVISLTTALTAGQQVTIVVREANSLGVAIEFPVLLTAGGATVPVTPTAGVLFNSPTNSQYIPLLF